MANVAISALPSASTLTGPELLAVVQSGTTKKSTVDAVYQYVLSQSSSPVVGGTLVKRDSFGTIAAAGIYSNDDGFGGGGFVDVDHQVTIGGYCTVADYLEVFGEVVLAKSQGRITWTNAGAATFELGANAGLTHLKCFQNFEVGGTLKADGNLTVAGDITFGSFAAITGVITGSVAIQDNLGNTVHLMAFT